MSNKTYDNLKFIALVVFPAITTFVGTTLTALNVPNKAVIIVIMTAFNTMLGTIINKLSTDYKKEMNKNDKTI